MSVVQKTMGTDNNVTNEIIFIHLFFSTLYISTLHFSILTRTLFYMIVLMTIHFPLNIDNLKHDYKISKLLWNFTLL